MRAGPAAGSSCLPGLSDVPVARFRAQQKNPMEHGDETVGNRAEHKDVQRSHAAFEEREVHFRRDISERQKRPCGQARNKYSHGFVAEAQDRNCHQHDDDCASDKIACASKRLQLGKAIGYKKPCNKNAR